MKAPCSQFAPRETPLALAHCERCGFKPSAGFKFGVDAADDAQYFRDHHAHHLENVAEADLVPNFRESMNVLERLARMGAFVVRAA